MGCRDNVDGSRNAAKKARRCRARVSKGIVVRRASRFLTRVPPQETPPSFIKNPIRTGERGRGGNMCKGATNPPCHPASPPSGISKQGFGSYRPRFIHSIHFFFRTAREGEAFFFLGRIQHTMNDNQRNGCGGGEGDWSQADEGMEEGKWGSFA